jgi:hypothetical protein
MVRWYDYCFAFLFADLITALLFYSTFQAELAWQIIFSGFAIGLLFRLWTDFYCKKRKTIEENMLG